MGKLEVALIGAGYWGRNYAKDLVAMEDVDLKYVVDPSSNAVDMLESRKVDPSILIDDYDIVLNDNGIEAVFIVTPARTHTELGKKALNAGKHVFLEKPMAPTVVECEDLIKAERKNKSLLYVGHQYVHHPIVQIIKEQYIDTGRLGEIQAMHFVRDGESPVRPDVDSMWDLAPHDLSIALYCGTASPTLVSAEGRTTHGASVGLETTVQMLLDTDKYPITIRSSNTGARKQRRFCIQGEYYTIEFDETAEEKFKVIKTPHTGIEPTYDPGDISEALNCQCLALQTRDFIDLVKGGYLRHKPVTNSVFGMQVVQLLTAANESMYQGRPVEINSGLFVGGGDYNRAPRLEIVHATEELPQDKISISHEGELTLENFEHMKLVRKVSERLPEDNKIYHLTTFEENNGLNITAQHSPFSLHSALGKPPSLTNRPFYTKVPERKRLADEFGVMPLSAMSLVLTKDNRLLFGKRKSGTETKGDLSLVASGFHMEGDEDIFETSKRSFTEELGFPLDSITKMGWHGLTYADSMNRGFGAAITMDCNVDSSEAQNRFLEHKAGILERIAMQGGRPSEYVFTRLESIPFQTEELENYILSNRTTLDMHSVGAVLLVARNRLHMGQSWFNEMIEKTLPENYGRILVHPNSRMRDAESAKQFVINTNSLRFLKKENK